MAQAMGLVNLMKIKIDNITSQRDQLHGTLDNYVHQVTAQARETLDTEEQDVNKLREINSAMDTVLEYLVNIKTQMDERSKDICTRGRRNAPRGQPSTRFFTSICRECTVCHDTGIVSYTSLSPDVPVGQFISASPLTPKCPSFSFEITNPGASCYIAIGVCPNSYPPNRQPGWNPGSIGYHADDGGVYQGAGRPTTYFEICHQGDIMKCELNFRGGSIKFFINDRLVNETVLQIDFANLHAAIGLHSVGEAVRLLEKEPWQKN